MFAPFFVQVSERFVQVLSTSVSLLQEISFSSTAHCLKTMFPGSKSYFQKCDARLKINRKFGSWCLIRQNCKPFRFAGADTKNRTVSGTLHLIDVMESQHGRSVSLCLKGTVP
jgi:hypothetical protein